MPRKELTAEEYTRGIQHLTKEDLVRYGERIVSSTMGLAILEQKYGPDIDRNILIQKCRRDQLHPMGRYGAKTLYFWRSEIEALTIHREASPQKAK